MTGINPDRKVDTSSSGKPEERSSSGKSQSTLSSVKPEGTSSAVKPLSTSSPGKQAGTIQPGKQKIISRTVFWFVVLGAGLILIFLLNIGAGSADISVTDIMNVFLGKVPADDTHALIIQKIRLPRALASAAGGAALAIAGFLLQTFFSNPIVEPYVLGISSGSSLFVGLVVLGGFSFGFKRVTPFVIFGGAFIGAMAVMSIVIFAARKVKSIITLLIIGMMAGYLCSAVTSILSAFAEKEQLANYAMWTMGSFSGFTWKQIGILFAIVLPMIVAAFLMAKPLNALNMGDKYAQSMGVNVKLVRYALIFISSILTAAVTAFAGPVSFIGLAVPHICRILFGTSNSRILIPATAVGGAFMAGTCDFTARNIVSPVELPLGAITAIIGAPIVVYLLTRRNVE